MTSQVALLLCVRTSVLHEIRSACPCYVITCTYGRMSLSACSTASAVGRAVRSCDVIVTINSLTFLTWAETSSSKSTAIGISLPLLRASYISWPRPFSASFCRISDTEASRRIQLSGHQTSNLRCT